MGGSRFDTELVSIYRAQGVLTEDDRPVHLPTECPKSGSCWKHAQHRMPVVGEAATEISPPWIGAAYEPGGLLVVMLNMNGWGGFDMGPNPRTGNRFLARSAKVGFAQGHRRLFAGNGYRGTMVWHQAAQYAAAWLHLTVGVPRVEPDGRHPVTELPQVLDRIAITQHVKCSPMSDAPDERSAPTSEMWVNCGAHLLIHELEILQPSAVLALGTSDNLAGVSALMAARVGARVEERVMIGRGWSSMSIESMAAPFLIHPVQVIGVPHPSAVGGTAARLIPSLRNLLRRAAGR
jgi:hypothetical protein